nr:unnamed protein product [Leishmania braziliensis]
MLKSLPCSLTPSPALSLLAPPTRAGPRKTKEIAHFIFKRLYSLPLSLVRAGLLTEDDGLLSSKWSVHMPLLPAASPPTSDTTSGAVLASPTSVISSIDHGNRTS